MASRLNVAVQGFNRGVVSPLALARVDIARMALSAETQTNWMPRTLGSMMLRPGLQYQFSTRNDAQAVSIPFVFASDDVARLELTDSAVRVIIDDAVVTRGSVSTTITNGTFGTDVSGWTDTDESGATSSWLTGGYLSLVGTASTAAIRRQTLTISAGDQNDEHAVTLVVTRGVVTLKIGTASGTDDLLAAENLGEGTHYLAFTPTTGSAYLELSSSTKYATLIDSIAIASAGELVMTSPYVLADLANIRYAQSGDIVFLACVGKQQYKIERRAARSWSVVKYMPPDGPFRNTNSSAITLAPSAVSGDITLTASRPLFKSTHVGALFSIDSVGQLVSESISAETTFTDPIRVSGVEASRAYTILITGTWVGTVSIQRSIGSPGAWVDINAYTTNQNYSYTDGLDNQIVYYRLGIKAGNYTSGTAVCSLIYSGGSLTGIVRVVAVASSTSASAVVLKDLGGTSANDIWAEGSWSDRRGWPSAVSIYEGRAWWAGKGTVFGSVSDSTESFSDEIEGDSGPLNRSIGYGPVDTINWLLPVQRLIMGTDSAEVSARSTSFDEPLTPTNFNLKSVSTQGSSRVAAVMIDTKGLFVQKSGTRLYELAYDQSSFDYSPTELTVLSPEIGQPSITRMAVQRQPDTRVHCVRSDGKVAMLVFDRAENVTCWVLVETDGDVEDVVVLPGTIEDSVYYIVKRTIGGVTKRYWEKWALESECQGGAVNKQADSFVYYDGAATASMAGLSHLEGETVVVWADGVDAGTKVVSGGAITLDTAASQIVAGLGYDAEYESTKLAYGAQMGTALLQRKRVSSLGFILKNTHIHGIQFGPDFDHLDYLSLVVDGEVVSEDTILAEYDADALSFNGSYNTDSRVCLKASAPRPATVLACIYALEVNEKV